jgi:hypothetical protein
VQTCEMKRDNFKIYLVPKAIAYTDQSDEDYKQSRICPTKIEDLYRIWTAPYSPRNLVATLYASWYHQNCIIGKIVLPIVYILARIIKPIVQYLVIKLTGKYYR